MKPIDEVARFMKEQGLVLVTAESCTAGLIAAKLAEIAGAGDLLDCAFVVYSPEAKQYCLSVRPETIAQFNLSSEEVAREMALGALKRSRANVAIANTGVTDDTPDDDVAPGTQCFAWAFQRDDAGRDIRVFTETRRFEGSRNEIRDAGAQYALQRAPFYYSQLAVTT